VALVAALAEFLRGATLEYSYRFLFIPGTIGSITWLARNETQASRIRHGLVVACVGDSGKFHYKRSRRGNAEIDRAVIHALRHSGEDFEVREFSPYGYDERQFCSPGFNLAVGSLTRTPHGEFPEYHTSADNLDLVRPEALAGSLGLYLSVLRILENDARFQNQNPRCEPQLGKRGLYRTLGGLTDSSQLEMAMLWILNLSDGGHSLLDIAERAELPFDLIHRAAQSLIDCNLLARCTDPSSSSQEITTNEFNHVRCRVGRRTTTDQPL
jgi:aminopeptidase-like protein